MKQHPSQLERVTIGQPCATSWQAMTGDERRRYCQQCDKHVHNFSAMTRDEIEALLHSTPGRVCARFERKPDGEIVTRENSESATKRHFNLIPRASRMTAAAMSALLSVSVNVSKAWAAKPAAQLQSPPQKNDEQNKLSQTSSLLAGIAGTVVDPSGAVIPNAQLTLVNQRTQKTADTHSDSEGNYQFESLESGTYTLAVESLGFLKTTFTSLTLIEEQILKQDVTLQVGALEMIGVVAETHIERPITFETLRLLDLKPMKKDKTKKSFASILWSPIIKLFKRHESKSTPR